ncbi:MAG TPA: carboxypeptidase-like regulatory domain-containing protein [Bryobacteraceae bacterium]|nr:carboxypeptidase-like regulatory domain-containing protein [Bryobacteraceae bacterium]
MAGRRCLVASLGLLFASSAASPQSPAEAPKKAHIEGRVLSLSDGTPLAGASVRVKAVVAGFESAPDPNESVYSGQAGAGGQYIFEGVAPGSYRIYADQPGYVRRFYGATSVTTLSPGTVVQVAAGQTLKNLDVELAPQGSISGHVRDENDEPVRDASATALRMWYEDGHRELLPLSSADTDVDGGFTLRSLPPGKYYIRVEQKAPPRVAGAPGAGQQREAMPTMLRRTFYPDAEVAENAAPLTLTSGTAVRGIDFHLKRAKLVAVRGEVDWGSLGPPAQPLILALMPATFDLIGTVNPRFAHVQQDGGFAFDEVVAGTYYLEPARVRVDTRANRKFGGTTVVEVRDEDVSGIHFHALPAPDLIGRIRIEDAPAQQTPPAIAGVESPTGGSTALKPARGTSGGAPVPPPPGYKGASSPQRGERNAPSADPAPGLPATGAATAPAASVAVTPVAAMTVSPVAGELSLADVGVRLIAAERVSLNLPQAATDASGSFLLPAVPPERYLVETANLPEGTYLKTVSFNGQNITNAVLDVSSGFGGDLNLVLSKNAGEVSGTVRDGKDNALPAVWVSLWRTDSNPVGSGGATTQVVSTDGQGTFQFRHLAPGKYRVAAWEEIEYGLAQAAAFCRMFERDGVSIALDKGGREAVALKPIPSALIEEAVWKTPR